MLLRHRVISGRTADLGLLDMACSSFAAFDHILVGNEPPKVKNLKAWKVCVLRGREIRRNSAEGDCKRQRCGIKSENQGHPRNSENSSPSLSALVAINVSTTTESDNNTLEIENNEDNE
ncbi:unnamed protein product [Hymenolepis diminuta]|uniref:Uncharacterized protein n=1 Tax=Hymenolepis diminuta TaxID=6216 RepID=A0A564Z7Z2_HYMDI|nr:unnamed protein product [Hymenolepis diminuta]